MEKSKYLNNDNNTTVSAKKVYIRYVDLSDAGRCTEVADYFAEHGKRNPDVQIMCLEGCNLGCGGASIVARIAISHYTNLTNFSLYDNDVGDDGAIAASTALGQHCPKLKKTSFGCNKITDIGFGGMCEQLPVSELTVLDVRDNEITTIPSSFARFTKLKEFDAVVNNWSEWTAEYGVHYKRATTAMAIALRKQQEEDDLSNSIMIKSAAKGVW